MFAVVKTGGKQYKVAKDDIVVVEKLAGDAGATVELDQVLMLGEGGKSTVGAPTVEGALVTAEVVEQTRGPKITIFKKKRRKHYQRTAGHRQDLTVLRVTEILTEGAKPAKKAAAPKTDAPKTAEGKTKAKVEEKAAPKKAAAPKKTTAPKKAPAKKVAPKKTTASKKVADKTKE